MKKIGFYVLGKKGYKCLTRFFKEYGSESIAFVVLASDKGVKRDYFKETSEFCKKNSIDFYDRYEPIPNESNVNFAIGWRWMISNSDNLIVFHDSLLPEYRGFAPLVNMLISGEERIGVTALRACENYDSGDIIDQQSVAIEYPIKIADAIDIVSALYEEVLLSIASQLLSGSKVIARPQEESRATFSLWRDEFDYEINWSSDAETIQRFVDAVGYPYAGAKTRYHGQWVRVLDVELVRDVQVENRESHLGKILFMNDEGPTVICGRGLIKLRNVVSESGDYAIEKIPFRTRFGV